MVVGTTTAIGMTTAMTSGATTAKTTAIIVAITTIAGLIRVATEIAVMAITISAITSENAIASTKESTIVIPRKLLSYGI